MHWGLAGRLAVFISIVSVAIAADWPNWRGPDRNGIARQERLKTVWQGDVSILWKGQIGTGFSSMAVMGGRVYAMGNRAETDSVYCLDALTGQVLWRHNYPCPLYPDLYEGGPSATPTVDQGRVYTISKAADAFCLDAVTGKVIWKRQLAEELGIRPPRWCFAGSPVIYEDLVIYNAGDAGLALMKKDGQVAWQNGTGPCGYSTGVIGTLAGKETAVLMGLAEVVGVDPRTGKVLWRYPWKTSWDINAADPIVVDGMLFVSSGYNKGCALLRIEADHPEAIWTSRAMCNHINSSILWNGYIYGFDGQVGGGDSGKLRCIEAASGRLMWSAGGMGVGSLILADGKLVILSENGRLVIADARPDGFKELASAQILEGKCWTSPVLANGLLYARNAEGQIVCVDLRP
ncbi:MAG: PQQ-like beta-propeller repeat protein [Sedimentisphaerales bacterium]|jgi:outer membrane protein assembly factor BamB|nr:PQQ-like beta-propeller repeat protein [Sedimentisphaerales bacterium]